MAFAYTVAAMPRVIVYHGEARDEAGAYSTDGAITAGTIDITSYHSTNSVPAAAFGLTEIWSVVFSGSEVTKNVAMNAIIASNGKTCELIGYDTDATLSEISDDADGGEWSFVAAGLREGSIA